MRQIKHEVNAKLLRRGILTANLKLCFCFLSYNPEWLTSPCHKMQHSEMRGNRVQGITDPTVSGKTLLPYQR